MGYVIGWILAFYGFWGLSDKVAAGDVPSEIVAGIVGICFVGLVMRVGRK